MAYYDNKNEERKTFFQTINFIIPYLYTAGIILILVWMIISSVLIGINTYRESPKDLFLPLKSEVSISLEETKSNGSAINAPTASTNQDTWLNTLIKPIIESDFNRVIFRGLFLLLIWMLLFLIIPVAFKRLKRFKFFNMEFEVDSFIEQAAIETVEISGNKAQLMAYLTSDDATGRTLDFLNNNTIDFKEVLEYFLAEIQAGYKKHPFHAAFTFKVHDEILSVPDNLKDLIEESRESDESVIFNKNNQENIYKKNYLVLYFCYGDDEYVTVLSSYTYPFDILDKYLFELLHNTVAKNVENIEYMVALTNIE